MSDDELPRTLHDDFEQLRTAFADLGHAIFDPPMNFISGIIFPDIDNDKQE